MTSSEPRAASATAEVAVFAGIRGPARTFSYAVPDELTLLPGHLVRVGLGRRTVPGVVIALDGAAATTRELRPIAALVHPLPLLRPHQLALARWIAERYRCALADAVRAMLPPALAAITAALARVTPNAAGRSFLLHGVTGSGKTEVYLRATAAALARGDGVIVLVPEIVLTAQVVARFIARFGARIALLHSALSAGERFDEWRRVLDGTADVVIGSRSALFAPLDRVGLVVVDEEQEPSYKQESDPRHHAVDAALPLRRISGATVVLGSATPRVATYHAARSGDLTMLTLPERIGALPLPPTTLVDLRIELARGNRGTLSEVLREALQRTVARGAQAMLYLNRRGFATVVLCRDCGYVVKCPACEIPYAYHVASGAGLAGFLGCPRCGRRGKAVPTTCPACGHMRIKQLGVGTQRVEEEVRAAVPRAGVIRLDRDALRAKGAHVAAYERMRSGDAQVIVGTQMLAKGFDLPLVALVGVVNADTVLNLPDFTAAERTFQLLTQVLGRSGRGTAGGHRIPQAYLPERYPERASAPHDHIAFPQAQLPPP